MTTSRIIREFYRSNEYLLKQDYVFSGGIIAIAKHFLKDYFLINNIFKLTFDEIRTEYTKINPTVPIKGQTELEYYKELCETFFRISKDPSNLYSDYIENARKHLAMIEDNINYCQKEIQREQKNQNIDTYFIKKMKYFTGINQEQKEEIIKFLIHDIKQRVLNDCRLDSKYFISFLDVPYTYCLLPDSYDPSVPHHVEAKFGSVGIPEYRKILEMHETDREEYFKYINNYVKTTKTPEIILENIKNNYYLNQRFEIMEVAIDNYNKGNYLVFINIATIQAEGMFFDYCKAIEIQGIEDQHDTLVQKIEKIKTKTSFYGYEYYAYDFPKLRNEVAHGRFLLSQLNTANELILDLNYLVGMFNSINIPLNIVTQTLNDFSKEKPDINDLINFLMIGTENKTLFSYLLDTTSLFEPQLNFYKLTIKKEEVSNFLLQDQVWDELIKRLEAHNSIFLDISFNNKIETVKNIFMASRSYKTQAIKICKKLGEIRQKYKLVE